MLLPEEFTTYTHRLLGSAQYDALAAALDEESPTSIRLNPFKTEHGAEVCAEEGRVPWCEDGFYLSQRPNFTFDPLLHAGVYYVQEAASMFVVQVLQQKVDRPVVVLDLCAAPGGKSTAARAVLPPGSVLFCNEPIAQRAQILTENVQKFGHPDMIVTQNSAGDYRRSGLLFDVILADVPCSGEGMFRKDPGAVAQWSRHNVERCQRLQRNILGDIWPCLRPGGLLIYSTCTFNAEENERNVEWIAQELGAEALSVCVEENWNIAPAIESLLPAYRFLPGQSRSEGLFMAVLQKTGDDVVEMPKRRGNGDRQRKMAASLHWLASGTAVEPRQRGELMAAIPSHWIDLYDTANEQLHLLHAGVMLATTKGKDFVPHPSLALSTLLSTAVFPTFDLDYGQAIAFLRKETVTLPPTLPRGFVLLRYRGIPLGFEKNIGHRANNLYPQEWRIKSTHIPEEQTVIKVITQHTS